MSALGRLRLVRPTYPLLKYERRDARKGEH